MPSKKALLLIAVAVVASGFLTAVPGFAASKEKVLYSFCGDNWPNCTDGANPYAGLIFGADGNLYGTTTYGGSVGSGTIFQLMPSANGQWAENVIHSFAGDDGFSPLASVVFDPAGNLYTTAAAGGTRDGGTVVELMPGSDNTWTEKILYDFKSGGDGGKAGFQPAAEVILDVAGNLYGTTEYGGRGGQDCDQYYCGTAFMLTTGSKGERTAKVMHSFTARGGNMPVAGLIGDASGNLYGTASAGGRVGGRGIVFRLRPDGSNKWRGSTLHGFSGKDGASPYARLISDSAGNLYGTTSTGGAYDPCGSHPCGTIFELSPGQNGGWTFKVLHSFGKGSDGFYPQASLILDGAGNLYGTTSEGGGTGCYESGCGTVFELSPGKNGNWKDKVLHRFSGADGWLPTAGMVFDGAGNLYGTTAQGGANGSGTVFEITP